MTRNEALTQQVASTIREISGSRAQKYQLLKDWIRLLNFLAMTDRRPAFITDIGAKEVALFAQYLIWKRASVATRHNVFSSIRIVLRQVGVDVSEILDHDEFGLPLLRKRSKRPT